jgi:simple sugar transport system substrate-binding protein
MKKLIVLVIALMMALSLVGCASNPQPSASESTAPSAAASEQVSTAPAAESSAPATEDKGTPVIAFVPKVIGQAWWDYVRDGGVTKWSEENGIEVKYQGPTEVDAAAQVQIMTDLVAQDIDILLFSPNDPDACENICKEARDKGIIVIATEASGMKNVDYDVEAFDEKGLGGFMMDELAKQMGEEGEYITMVGSMTMESHNNWADAAVARQAEAYPNMKLVDDKRVSSESDAEVAYQKTKELLKKYPNLKGILGTSSFDAPGAARAIQELGLSGKVFAISVALPSETRDYLKEGVLQSVALWDPALSAKAMLNLAMAMWKGEEVKTGMDLGVEGYNSVSVTGTNVIGKGWIAITKDNVDTFTF